MGEIVGLKFHLPYLHISQSFFEIPTCGKMVIFVNDFVKKRPPVYEEK